MNQHLSFPFGFTANDNTPLDGKYGIISGGVWRPYNDTAEALTALPSGVRHRGLTVNIAGVEYWWKDGVLDAQLIVKQAKSNNGVSDINLTGL